MSECRVSGCRLTAVTSSGMAQMCAEHDALHLLEMLPRVMTRYPPPTWLAAMREYEERFGPIPKEIGPTLGERMRQGIPPAKPDPSPERSVVYFLEVGDTVKIGTAIRLRERMKMLALPAHAIVRLALDGSYELEARMHARFRDERLGDTEWFRLSPRLRLFIDQRAPATPAWTRSARSTASRRPTPTDSPASTNGAGTDTPKEA